MGIENGGAFGQTQWATLRGERDEYRAQARHYRQEAQDYRKETHKARVEAYEASEEARKAREEARWWREMHNELLGVIEIVKRHPTVDIRCNPMDGG